MLRCIAALSLVALTFILRSGADCAAATEPLAQQRFITKAIFADRRLWLLSESGHLSSIADHTVSRRDENVPERALALWVRAGEPALLTCDGDCAVWNLRHWTGANWANGGTVRSGGDRFVGLGQTPVGLTILTSRRLLAFTSKGATSTELSAPLRNWPIASVLIGQQFAFVGYNAGEFGGGLQRIDVRTGQVTDVDRSDRVNGIAPEPWNLNCVAIAIGLVHFVPSGRISELCGNTVQRIYSKALSLTGIVSGDGDRFNTVAFFGIAEHRGQLWAIGIDGLYRLSQSGHVQRQALPRFRNADGVYVSFDLPDVVLVLTEVTRHLSVSGATPMLIPR